MGKVLVRKAIEPVVNIGSSGPELAFQQTLGRSSADKNLPDRSPLDRVIGDGPHEGRVSGAGVLTARQNAAAARAKLADDYALTPQELHLAGVDPASVDRYTAERLGLQREEKAGPPRSYAERYAGDAVGRFVNRKGGEADGAGGRLRGARAADVGVRGRQFGRGLAGALAGLSFLGGLESAGAAGAGLEQGIGGGALRAQATYGQAAPMLTNVGGEAGARLGAGSVGVRERMDAARARRAAAQQPVAVAAPTVLQRETPQRPPLTDAERAELEREESRLQGAVRYAMPGSLPGFENRLVGIGRRLNPSTSDLPFDMRGGALNEDMFFPQPQFDPTSRAVGAQQGQTTLSSLIGVQPSPQPTVAAPTPVQPVTDLKEMAAAFNPQSQNEPAAPEGGADAAKKQAEELSQKFMEGMSGE